MNAARLVAFNVTRGEPLTTSGRLAHTFLTRLIGLMLDKSLAEGDGLWIMPCNSIHSFWMKFDFDAVFLDKDLRVVHLMSEMKPSRISKMVWNAKSVLELPAGVIARTGTALGDQFEMRLDAETVETVDGITE
jgi:uncharacterized membrane protein (UPF0127 family)